MTDTRADISLYLCDRSGGGWRILSRHSDSTDAKRAARGEYPGQSHFLWKPFTELGGSYPYDTTARGIVIVLDAMGIARAREKWGMEDGGSGLIPDWSSVASKKSAQESANE